VALAEVREVSKRFGGTQALDRVSLRIDAGTVHALLGENGSGKSTLVKVLCGVHRPDSGEVEVGGSPVEELLSPQESARRGIAVVHQAPTLVAELTIRENLALARGFTSRRGLVDWAEEDTRARAELSRLDLHLDPGTVAGDLDPTAATLVRIAQALSQIADGGALVLDEPTASLPEDRVDDLHNALRHLVGQGVGVLYISHRLGEVVRIADVVTVLRNGRTAWHGPMSATDRDALVIHITGHLPGPSTPVPADVEATTGVDAVGRRLIVDGLEAPPLPGLSLHVDAGEVLGVTGLLGSGMSTLGRVLGGALPPRSGRVRLDGRELDLGDPQATAAAGIAYLAPSREAALLRGLDLAENVSIANLPLVTRRGLARRQAEEELAADLIHRLDIRPPDPGAEVATLSGGNQQKVVVGRLLLRDPVVLVVDEPTHGVDVGARERIHEALREHAGGGGAVMLLGTDLAELAHLCDRVLILAGGRVATEMRAPLTEPALAAAVHRAVAA
jgi:ABC-type sugar transport system ATPase subunit